MEFTAGSRVDHPKYGEGIVSKVNITSYEIFFERAGKMEISKSFSDMSLLEQGQETAEGISSGLSLYEIEKVLSFVLDKYGAIQENTPIADKWKGGSIILQPAKHELKPKEIPIEVFFHKIVMLRDRLRVLEQNINSHPVLSEEDKINLQAYITRIYGSLTTFNVLFNDKDHYFKGTSGS
ncbi:MAG: hypothetical protein NTW49_01425 [Bacteroidia bacterium]|nr:hypothetical protein [Bacteroidia bacterium]